MDRGGEIITSKMYTGVIQVDSETSRPWFLFKESISMFFFSILFLGRKARLS